MEHLEKGPGPGLSNICWPEHGHDYSWHISCCITFEQKCPAWKGLAIVMLKKLKKQLPTQQLWGLSTLNPLTELSYWQRYSKWGFLMLSSFQPIKQSDCYWLSLCVCINKKTSLMWKFLALQRSARVWKQVNTLIMSRMIVDRLKTLDLEKKPRKH